MKGRVHMKVKQWLCGILTLYMLFTTGCWDRIEVNDIALIMGTAFDLTPDGKLQMASQIMVPLQGGGGGGTGGSSGGGQEKKYFTESAVGIDPGDALAKLQEKFSRRLFRGHRKVIIIGEELAIDGVGGILDSLSRDPQNRLRTHMLVAKGKQGRDLLKTDYPLERVPTEGMREMERSGIDVEITIRDFLIAASSEGIQPVAAVIEPSADKKGFQLSGMAVFKDLKLVGYLSDVETRGYLWISGKYKKGTVTTSIPGIQGIASVDVSKAKSKIKPEVTGDKVRINVELSAEGVVYGNSTNLDLTIPKNITLIEKATKAEIKKRVQLTLNTVQKKYRSDIFGFGSLIYQTSPKQWQQLKDKWDEIFPEAEVLVSIDLTIRRTGMSGPPLHLKENEVKK